MSKFKFIDLFAGIGGFHLAMEKIGGECVFASEIDKYARETYIENFYKKSPALFEDGFFNDDIRKIIPSEIPDFDVLCAGFPCQPFSQAGYRRGFEDNHNSERGNLFFNIVDILDAKRPKAFFLENVRGIINHDKGKTFRIIREILENELGYSFYYKIVKASDYGLPQLRPRTFMIGFRDDGLLKNFEFPPHTPLKFNMSDVWGGVCSRELGYTIRVGGRGSNINDRRNWDSYLVDGKVKKLMPQQAKKMQGFPEDFVFPVTDTQAMKQLGNSVAVDAVRACAEVLVKYMNSLEKGDIVQTTKNKGEWTELYSFLKILYDKKLILADKNLEIDENSNFFLVSKVTTLNISQSCYIEDDFVSVVEGDRDINKIKTSELLNDAVLKDIAKDISQGKKTFNMPKIEAIEKKLGISIVKGGKSDQKADIILDIHNSDIDKKDEGFGIKSYLGSKPTLMNASGNTNFIFEVEGLDSKYFDEINSIKTRTKLKDRIEKIYALGGSLKFYKIETETMAYNLSLVDSIIPELISDMLLEFYINRINKIDQNLKSIYQKGKKYNTDIEALQVKIKRLLVSILLGFFAGKKWDGKYIANGTIVVKESGEQVGFHVVELSSLEDFLYNNIKFDTPSTTRHRYGSLIAESDGKLYFKLNLQLRF